MKKMVILLDLKLVFFYCFAYYYYFFGQTLLAFVNCHLYHSINVRYPPILDPQLEALAAGMFSFMFSFSLRLEDWTDFPVR